VNYRTKTTESDTAANEQSNITILDLF